MTHRLQNTTFSGRPYFASSRSVGAVGSVLTHAECTESPCGPTAVDDEVVSRHVRRRVGCEVEERSGHLVRAGHPSERRTRSVLRDEGRLLAGLDAAGGQRVTADAVLRVVDRRVAYQRDD